MNSKEFYDEVVSSNLCPDNFPDIYNEFQKYQSLADETLREFHRVCEKCGINYQLAYGSLLGAIRNNGQIPWDYDVDVFVPYEEKEKLIFALKNELSDKFYFVCPEVDKKCRHVIMRLAPKGYRSEVLHVDVFYLIGVPNNDIDFATFCNKIKDLSNKRYFKLVHFFDENRRIKSIIKKCLYKILYLFFSCEKGYEKYNILCNKFKLDKSKFCVSADTSSCDYKFDTGLFKKTKFINTSIGEFRIPVNFDKILHIIYGDYNEIFPLQNRINELLTSYDRLNKFAKINSNKTNK